MGRPRKRMPPPDAQPVTCRKCNETKPALDFYWRTDGTLQAFVCRPCFYYRPTARRTVACPCGVSFETGYAKAQFCSRACKDRAKNAVEQAERLAAKAHQADRQCPTCGDALTAQHRSDATFCSVACSDKAHNITRKIRKRVGESGPRPRKTKLVSLAAIGDRDNWRCGICGGLIDKAKRHPAPLAASIDHIVPIAKGGTNDPENLQIAHFRCNWKKGGRL